MNNTATLCSFVEGVGIGNTADTTGNAITAATSRSVTTSASLTANALVGKFIKITSGAGINQVALITSNTTNLITIEGTFDITPVATDTFSTFSSEAVLFLGNGANAYRKIFYDNTTAPVSGAFQFEMVEWHKNKLWGTRVGRIYFSNLGSGDYVGPNNYIEAGSYSSIPIIKSLGDRLVVYTDKGRYDLYGDNPDNFQLVPR